jgi:tetratricopeptide (TPR) repeat protein
MPDGEPTAHRPRLWFFGAAILLISAIPATVAAQVMGSFGHPDADRVTYTTAPNTAILNFKVFAERKSGHLDRQALVKLVNLTTQTATWQPTGDNAACMFTDIPFGDYSAEVSAVGYLSTHQDVKVIYAGSMLQFDLVLHRDPAAVNLDVAESILSAQARKESKRAISALKSGNLKDAQRHLDEAHKAAPMDAGLNFLLGYLYFQKKDFAQSTRYLGTAATINPHNVQALTLLGRASLDKRDYAMARSALEQAVMAGAEDWLPHNLLADAYLHEKNYAKARDEAQIAIAKGKNSATSAQLVLGEALLNLGQSQEGVQALTVFMQESPQHAIAGQVRNLIAEVNEHGSMPVETKDSAAPVNLRLSRIDPLSAIPAERFTLNSWQPPGVDDVKLAMATDMVCPSSQVIEKSGNRVQELVQDVSRFAAVEDLFHQALDQYGTPVRTETRKFNYVASISEPQPGFLAVDEFRADKLSFAGYPDSIASTGFAALALIFHPHMRDNFEMLCEGLGDWHGQASWLVHFRQRDDRPNRMHNYKVGNQYHSVNLKGRAWITADKFQIVRIEAEMVSPMPEIQLRSEHQVVEYGPIPFAKKNTTLWLPKSAEIYFDVRKHRYYRRHSFDHYMLYSVDSDEKRKEPVAPTQPGKSGTHS